MYLLWPVLQWMPSRGRGACTTIEISASLKTWSLERRWHSRSLTIIVLSEVCIGRVFMPSTHCTQVFLATDEPQGGRPWHGCEYVTCFMEVGLGLKGILLRWVWSSLGEYALRCGVEARVYINGSTIKRGELCHRQCLATCARSVAQENI